MLQFLALAQKLLPLPLRSQGHPSRDASASQCSDDRCRRTYNGDATIGSGYLSDSQKKHNGTVEQRESQNRGLFASSQPRGRSVQIEMADDREAPAAC